MERFLMEYFVNSIWQTPLLAAAAWLILRAARPSPIAQHRVWIATLTLMLAMPLLTRSAATTPSSPAPTVPLFATAGDLIAPVHPTLTPLPIHRADIAPPAQSLPASALPLPTVSKQPASWLPPRELGLGLLATHWLVGFYLAVTAFMAVRLLCSWWLALRVVAGATPAHLDQSASALLDQCCERLAIRRPRVLVSPRTYGPMVVGVVRPALLLPEDFAAQLNNPATSRYDDVDETIEAVWLHELAHLRRRDYLANLACRIAALPIAYHPATHAIQRRIRHTREMVCDSIAAADMQSPLGYARCLVGLARHMHNTAAQFEAVGIMNGGILEERIMQLITTKPLVSMRMRAIRLAACAAIAVAVVTAATTLHLTPAIAQAASGTPPAPPAPAAAAVAPAAAPAAASSQSRPRVAVRPTPGAQPAESAGPSIPTPADMDALRIQYDFAKKVWDTLVTRQLAQTPMGDHIDTSSADFKKQLDDARQQYDRASKSWDEALAKRQTYFESVARAQQLAQQQVQLHQRQAQQLQQQYEQQLKQVSQLQGKLNDPALKAQVESLAKLKQQLDAADAQLSQSDVKATFQKLSNPEFQEAMADAAAKVNSPEIMEQMAKLTMLEQQLAELCYQLQDQQDRIRAVLQRAQAAPPRPAPSMAP